jgi:site-specific DNA-cytosine methylase
VRVLDLFAGIGGFSLGLERAGFETVAFCEIEPYAQKVLAKHWPGVPIYDDVREITAERLAGDGIGVDVITGGFPCQDISVAGKQAGIEGERSGLWSEVARLIGELRPRYAILENVTALISGSSAEPWPYDRCVCGWPYRWRGLHLPSAQQENGNLQRQNRCGDDHKGRRDIYGATGLGWQSKSDAEGNKQMGRSEMLDCDWEGGCGNHQRDIPALDIEKAASRILHGLASSSGISAEAQKRDESVDKSSQEVGCGDEVGDTRSQQKRPGSGGAGETCDSCGRAVVYESGRLRKRQWFNRVLGDLAEIGYDAEWHCIPASYIGACHRRDRVWIVANPSAIGLKGNDAEAILRQCSLSNQSPRGIARWSKRSDIPAPRTSGGNDGVSNRSHRLAALGNAVVPQIPELIGRAIMERAAEDKIIEIVVGMNG